MMDIERGLALGFACAYAAPMYKRGAHVCMETGREGGRTAAGPGGARAVPPRNARAAQTRARAARLHEAVTQRRVSLPAKRPFLFFLWPLLAACSHSKKHLDLSKKQLLSIHTHTNMATAAEHNFRFADPAAAQLAPGERGVRLRFAGGAAAGQGGTAVELYVKPSVLRSFSRVLEGMLDSCQQEAGEGSSGKASSSDPHLTVPLDGADDDPLAWDDALGVMYGTLRGAPFEVDWDSAERLLVLADKYDMPGVAAAVAAFLRSPRPYAVESQLHAHLNADNVWRWLQLVCRAGFDDLVGTCVDRHFNLYNSDLNTHGLGPLTIDQLHELSPSNANKVLAVLWRRAGGYVGEMFSQLSDVQHKLKFAPIMEANCKACSQRIFKGNKFCLHCGAEQ